MLRQVGLPASAPSTLDPSTTGTTVNATSTPKERVAESEKPSEESLKGEVPKEEEPLRSRTPADEKTRKMAERLRDHVLKILTEPDSSSGLMNIDKMAILSIFINPEDESGSVNIFNT